MREALSHSDDSLCEAIKILCNCDENNRSSQLHQKHLAIFNETTIIYFAVPLTFFDSCILLHFYQAAFSLLQRGAGPFRVDTSALTFSQAKVWNVPEIARRLFDFAENSNLEAFVLHSVADFDESIKDIAPIGADTTKEILNLFCSCDDLNAEGHVKHMHILNQWYMGEHIHWHPQLYERYVEDDNGFTLLEKYMKKGNCEIVQEQWRIQGGHRGPWPPQTMDKIFFTLSITNH